MNRLDVGNVTPTKKEKEKKPTILEGHKEDFYRRERRESGEKLLDSMRKGKCAPSETREAN